MTPFRATPELLHVAERVVWFQKPQDTLAAPVKFLAYAMQYGTADDWVVLQKAGIGLEQYQEALDQAPPGVLDARSWTYWQLKCGRSEVPPLPVRRIP